MVRAWSRSFLYAARNRACALCAERLAWPLFATSDFQAWWSRCVASLRSTPAAWPSFTHARLTRSAGLSSVSAHLPSTGGAAGSGIGGSGYVTDSLALMGLNSSAARAGTAAASAMSRRVRFMCGSSRLDIAQGCPPPFPARSTGASVCRICSWSVGGGGFCAVCIAAICALAAPSCFCRSSICLRKEAAWACADFVRASSRSSSARATIATLFAAATALPRTLGPSGALAGAGAGLAGSALAGFTSVVVLTLARAAGRASIGAGTRRANQSSATTRAAPTTAHGQVRRAGALSMGWNSGRSVDMGVSCSGVLRDGANGLHAAEEGVVDRVGCVGRGLSRQEGDGGRVAGVQHPDHQEAARAGVDGRAQRGGDLRAAVAQEAHGVRGGASGLRPLVGREQRVGIAELLPSVATRVGGALLRGVQSSAPLQHRIHVAAGAQRGMRDPPRGRAAPLDQAGLAQVHAGAEERERHRGGEHLAGGADDLVEAGGGHAAAQIVLLLAPADVIVGALVGVDGADRRDLGAARGVEPFLPVALRRGLRHLFMGAGQQRGQREDQDVLLHGGPPGSLKQKNPVGVMEAAARARRSPRRRRARVLGVRARRPARRFRARRRAAGARPLSAPRGNGRLAPPPRRGGTRRGPPGGSFPAGEARETIRRRPAAAWASPGGGRGPASTSPRRAARAR